MCPVCTSTSLPATSSLAVLFTCGMCLKLTWLLLPVLTFGRCLWLPIYWGMAGKMCYCSLQAQCLYPACISCCKPEGVPLSRPWRLTRRHDSVACRQFPKAVHLADLLVPAAAP